ncbi:MAG: DUF655 domain-containing protein, partial [Duncaniella sp.]|nr:DUF655 domain-containing protein [Duncaniella sp.]
KANYPSEYMAAVLTRNRSDINKLTGFMDECKRMKIPVLGPDINESFVEFGVNSHGDIRFGLAAIKGVGENVVKAIIAERKERGPFESIYDFVERVPSSAVNRRIFENLVYAGAFDSFEGVKREDFFYENPRGEVFTETLVRYGQAFQNDKHNSAMSLFGDDAEMSTAGRPPVVPQKEWASAVKLERERELVGMYLSAHPLDPYFMELTYGTCTVKGDHEFEPGEGVELTFGGMVVDFTSRPARNGGQFGILKIEDYTGSAEFMMFEQTYINFHNYGVPGTPILITGRYEKRFSSSPLRFNIMNIRLLNDVKGKLVHSITIDLPSDKVTKHIKELLEEEIRREPNANGELTFRIFDPSINRSLHLRSNRRIPISRKLIDTLTEEDINFTIND